MQRWKLPLCRIIDEHNWDVIFDFVYVTARLARQRILFWFIIQVALAFRATENFEKFFLDHGLYVILEMLYGLR